jgi:EAL domain-containing protein (putative c-di-GMP-specific phosphodiesterase class I)
MEASTNMLKGLRKLGFKIFLDDFGTGYAALGYLKRLPINYIKIDQSFVAKCVSNKQDAGIIEAIIAMAHNLDLKVVAEGVEKKSQLNFLLARKCDMAQGDYFSPPLPAEKITSILLR